jgi:hypothetical protein
MFLQTLGIHLQNYTLLTQEYSPNIYHHENQKLKIVWFYYFNKVWDSSVGTVIGYRLDGWISIPGRGTRFCFFSLTSRLDFGDHPPSH